MKTIKLALLAVGLTLLAGTSFAAGPVYTYVFTANPDFTTVYDGSTISLQGTDSTTAITLVDWNLLGWSGGPVTPSNSSPSFESFTFYDPSTFYGSFSITGFEPGSVFSGDNSSGGGDLNLFADPPGVWRGVPVGVPDNGTTLTLFVVAMSGLVAIRRRIRARA